jgi:cyclic pyranopterin phosphate synthase
MGAPLVTALPLLDTFGRVHTNLRVSVTDRCNLRCTYCMPEEATFLDRGEILTFEEITRFVRIAADLGVTKVRLTGGEPLMRRRLPNLVAMIAATPGIDDLGLTTNGLLLAESAAALRDAGLHRVTISLDTLDPLTFRRLTRRDGLDRVLEGIDAATAAGFRPKLNAVVVRGVNDAEVVPLALFARGRRLTLRFIEYMPIGAEPWERDKCVPAHEILDEVETHVGPLNPLPDHDPRAPATEFAYDDGTRVGVIASVSRPFCPRCNRLRLTADGKVRNCLFALDEVDVKALLRGGGADADIAAAVRGCVYAKWAGHEINSARFVRPGRTMHAIGG